MPTAKHIQPSTKIGLKLTAAEANHTEEKKLKKKLDAIFNKVQKILDTHTDEEPPKTLKIDDVRKPKIATTIVNALVFMLLANNVFWGSPEC